MAPLRGACAHPGLMTLRCGVRGRSLGTRIRAQAGCYQAHLLGVCTLTYLELTPRAKGEPHKGIALNGPLNR